MGTQPPPWAGYSKSSGQRKWSFHFTLQWWGHTWNPVSSSRLLSTRETWTHWRESKDGPQRWFRVWNISREERLRELGLFTMEKRRFSGILSMYINTWREGVKKIEPGSFECCPVTGPGAKGISWNSGGVVWASGNTFLLWWWAVEQVSQRGYGVSHLRLLQKPSRHSPGQPAPADPAWAGWLD